MSGLDKSHPHFERIVSELECNAHCETREASEALGGLFLERVDARAARLGLRLPVTSSMSHAWKPLVWAAYANQVAIAKRLLEHGFNVNEQEDPRVLTGYAPLHWASQLGHVEMVELLLDHGANVHVQDKHGNASKALATKKQHARVIALLSAAEKASPNVDSSEGRLDAFRATAENPQVVVKDDYQGVASVSAVTACGAAAEGAAPAADEGAGVAAEPEGGQCVVM